MTKLFFAACTLTLAATSAWGAANPQLLRLLPSDSKAIAGMDVSHAKASPFGQFLLSQAGPASNLDKLKAATGFDPRTDLLEIAMGGGTNGNGLVVGFGAFPIARLTTMAQMSGTPTSSYRGMTLISAGNVPPTPLGKGAPVPSVAAFLDGSTFAMGGEDLVKAAIDRWIGGAPASGILSQKASEVSASADAWVVVTSIDELTGAAAPQLSQQAAMAQGIASKIDTISGGLAFGDTNVTVHGQVQTRSTQDAQAISDIFQLLVAMAGPQATQNPLLGSLQFAPTGSAVNFTVTLTEQQVEDLVKPKQPARNSTPGIALE